jgi:hypothetical protein
VLDCSWDEKWGQTGNFPTLNLRGATRTSEYLAASGGVRVKLLSDSETTMTIAASHSHLTNP